MHGSDRGDVTKAGLAAGIAIAVLVSTAFIGWGLSKSAEYQRQSDYQASEYSAYTYDKVGQSCIGMSIVDKAECIEKARHERRTYERDEQDLVAQRQSALWAYIMGAAAVIGMGLSVIGVFLVWTTFRETRRTAKAAEDTLDVTRLHGEMQIQGNIGEFIFQPWIHPAEDSKYLIFIFHFKNTGHSRIDGIEVKLDVTLSLPQWTSPKVINVRMDMDHPETEPGAQNRAVAYVRGGFDWMELAVACIADSKCLAVTGECGFNTIFGSRVTKKLSFRPSQNTFTQNSAGSSETYADYRCSRVETHYQRKEGANRAPPPVWGQT